MALPSSGLSPIGILVDVPSTPYVMQSFTQYMESKLMNLLSKLVFLVLILAQLSLSIIAYQQVDFVVAGLVLVIGAINILFMYTLPHHVDQSNSITLRNLTILGKEMSAIRGELFALKINVRTVQKATKHEH